MEVIILIIIILIYCLALNVSLDYIFFGGAILICIFTGLFTLGFIYCSICLAFSKRKEASFIRMDYIKNSKYQVAYYSVEGVEYPCIFPKEGILEDKLYRKEKTYHVMLNKRMGKVYDRFAVTTCVLGLIFSMVLSIGIVFLYSIWV